MKLMLFEINKKRWLTLFLVALSATIFRLILQAFIPSSGSNPFPSSAIVKAGLLIPSFTIYALITYFLLAVVFVIIQGRLPGTKIKKGLMFGFLFCMMWCIYLFEPLPHVSSTSLTELFAYPIVDGISLVFLGLLLGKFVAVDSQLSGKVYINLNIVPLMAIPVCFLVLRVFCYSIIHIYSSFTANPLGTMIWAVASGIWIGVLYLFLGQGIKIESPMVKSLFFGIIVFGINLFLFNFFITLVFESDIADLVIRTMADIISVTIGVYIYEKVHFLKILAHSK
ncbi:hypothetical protein N1236_05640 [Acetivibrio thermocellus]|uniref:hypothetical protein n=1 Tax=Acetivibrio thermocellus TaxID=1515 RepID=UPI0021ADF106|nr:hypothetical protein [Acetivibrio thermocellus]UWV47991.1 hypothetical protein N1236_05640 [Acetivibrio thermocellus]